MLRATGDFSMNQNNGQHLGSNLISALLCDVGIYPSRVGLFFSHLTEDHPDLSNSKYLSI